MAENFKKFKGGPTPAAHDGNPASAKTSGAAPMKHPHGQDPKLSKHPGRSTKHSPPVTPHHTTNPSWVYGGTHPMQIRPTLGPLVRPWAPLSHPPMMRGQGGQSKPEGNRYPPGGGDSMRPNSAGQSAPAAVRSMSQMGTHNMAGPQKPKMKHMMTKKIMGMIGKGKKKVHRSPY